jgi:hypothetical protein
LIHGKTIGYDYERRIGWIKKDPAYGKPFYNVRIKMRFEDQRDTVYFAKSVPKLPQQDFTAIIFFVQFLQKTP